MNRIYQLTIKAFFALLLLACCEQLMAQNPVSYSTVRSSSHVAEFDFEDLDREILQEKVASFFATQPVTMDFQVLVQPDGTVRYVRAAQCPAEQLDFKKGGTSALYGYAFAPVDSAEGTKWLKVRMSVSPD